MVCEGTDYFGAMAAFEFNINAEISKNLGSPILLVANAMDCRHRRRTGTALPRSLDNIMHGQGELRRARRVSSSA